MLHHHVALQLSCMACVLYTVKNASFLEPKGLTVMDAGIGVDADAGVDVGVGVWVGLEVGSGQG